MGSDGGASGLRVEEGNHQDLKGEDRPQEVGEYTTSQKNKFFPPFHTHRHSVNLVQFYYDIRHDLIFYHVKSMLSLLVAFKYIQNPVDITVPPDMEVAVEFHDGLSRQHRRYVLPLCASERSTGSDLYQSILIS
jgi:hypothetical protein